MKISQPSQWVGSWVQLAWTAVWIGPAYLKLRPRAEAPPNFMDNEEAENLSIVATGQ